MKHFLARWFVVAVIPIGLAVGCGGRPSGSPVTGAQPPVSQDQAPAAGSPVPRVAMKLSGAAFGADGRIAPKYTCDGDNISPPLDIADVPPGTQSLALVMDDPDAPGRTFDHWVVWNIPPDTRHIAEGTEPEGVAGRNSTGRSGYVGPCPPSGTHRYHFKLYALDTVLDLPEGSTKAELESAMDPHVLGWTVVIRTYSRP